MKLLQFGANACDTVVSISTIFYAVCFIGLYGYLFWITDTYYVNTEREISNFWFLYQFVSSIKTLFSGFSNSRYYCSSLLFDSCNRSFRVEKEKQSKRYWTRTIREQKHLPSSWFGTTPPHRSWRHESRRLVPRSSIAWIEWLPINRKLAVLFWSSLRRRAYPRLFLPSKVVVRTRAWCESSNSSSSSNEEK